MAPSFVQAASAISSTFTSMPLAMTAQPVSAGDAIVAFAIAYLGSSVTFSTPTDNSSAGSNTYTEVAGSPFSNISAYGNACIVHVYTAIANATMPGGLTLQFNNNNYVYAGCMAIQYTGVAAFALDQSSVSNSSSTSPFTATISNTTAADEVIIAWTNGQLASSGQSYGVSSPFNLRNQLSNATLGGVNCNAVADQIVSSIGNYPSTWTYGPHTSTFGILTLTFNTSAATYSISGNAGEAGATVSWTGTASGSTTADGSGNYTITGLSNGNYTITPTKTGYTFTPTSRSETVSGSNITGVNFTGTAAATTVFDTCQTFWMG